MDRPLEPEKSFVASRRGRRKGILRPTGDGWRRNMSVYLRKFGLSTFTLLLLLGLAPSIEATEAYCGADCAYGCYPHYCEDDGICDEALCEEDPWSPCNSCTF